jgi:hypothetical protein
MRSKGYLRGYLELLEGYLGVIKSLHRKVQKTCFENYLKKHLGIYLGYGVPKNHLGDYIQPTCMSRKFLKVGDIWELFRELLKVDS